MDEIFFFDKRLGISIPVFKKEWDQYSKDIQQNILFHWEKIRGTIPDRIKELENIINEKQSLLSIESDFAVSCRLNTEIAEHASTINELWLWFRVNQSVSGKMHT
ncbi:hypothetical protein D0469_05430 [Peribacillus saganii]|uniref:Uncharacterized protein n=1 Tax=Peribacillus saganii TaxID=2303992 RepID=A0A372LSI0_9BACI|nr:hypothetical protein [Peribacillus saganii]RFU70770.1 hypothetical protein D0469_05430 [Peribacillus saganii]